MTKDDIIKLAREAGFLIDTHAQQYQPNCILSTHGLIDENLQRFANLAAAAEREAIAKLVEPGKEHRRDARWGYIGGNEGVELLDKCAAAIRARGNT